MSRPNSKSESEFSIHDTTSTSVDDNVQSDARENRGRAKRRRVETPDEVVLVREGQNWPRVIADRFGSPTGRPVSAHPSTAGLRQAAVIQGDGEGNITLLNDCGNRLLIRVGTDEAESWYHEDTTSRPTTTPSRPTLNNLPIPPHSCEILPSERTGRPSSPTRKRSKSDTRELALRRVEFPHDAGGVDNEIKKALKKPLTKDMIDNFDKLGDSYVFRQVAKAANDGRDDISRLLKIGCSENIHDRLDKLRRLYGVGLEDAEALHRNGKMIPHFRRAELLIHTELLNCRYEHPSRKLGYTEWFLIDSNQAARVVQRWRRFMLLRPYDANGKLKRCWLDQLNKVPYPEREDVDDHDKRNERWNCFVDKLDQESLPVPSTTSAQQSARTHTESMPETEPAESNHNVNASVDNTTPTATVRESPNHENPSARTESPQRPTRIASSLPLDLNLWQRIVVHNWPLYCLLQLSLWTVSTFELIPWLSFIVACAWMIALGQGIRSLPSRASQPGQNTYEKAAVTLYFGFASFLPFLKSVVPESILQQRIPDFARSRI